MEQKTPTSWSRPVVGYKSITQEEFAANQWPVVRAHYGKDDRGKWHTQIVVQGDDGLASFVRSGVVRMLQDGDVPATDPTFVPLPGWMCTEPEHSVNTQVPEDASVVCLTYEALPDAPKRIDLTLVSEDTVCVLRFTGVLHVEVDGFPRDSWPNIHDVSAYAWEDVKVYAGDLDWPGGYCFFARDVTVAYTDRLAEP
jgi:hypothetical protein